MYHARDEVLRRYVALKVLEADSDDADSSREDPLREARASSALTHPNICTIQDVAHFEIHIGIVVEYVEGKTLSARRRKRHAGRRGGDPLWFADYRRAARAHSRSVVHRELKAPTSW